MKRTVNLLFTAAILLFGLNSCEDLENFCSLGEEDLGTGETFVQAFDNLTYLATRLDEANRDSLIHKNGAGVIDGATVTKTRDSLIFDYGVTGVICSDSKHRKGSMRAAINKDYLLAGGTLNAKLVNLQVDDVPIKGDINLENKGNTTTGFPEIAMNAANFEVEGVGSIVGALTMDWQSGFLTNNDESDDKFVLYTTGLSGKDFAQGNEYTATMTKKLVYDKACQWELESGVIMLDVKGPTSETDPTLVDLMMLDVDFLENDGCNNIYKVGVECEGSLFSITRTF